MRSTRRIVALGTITCSVFLLISLIAPTAASARPRIRVLLSGLSSPKGLALTSDGNLVVGQGAFGPPAPVLIYQLRGPDRGDTIEVTEPVNVMDVAESPDGSGWAIGGDRVLYRQDLAGNIAPVLDIPAYQETDPDPFDVEGEPGEPTESNPYGLAILPTGDALVADAAGNDLLRVTPDGDATTMARFDVESISTSHLPPEEGFPPRIDAEAVPTTVTIGPDGWVYVGELKGFPFRPRTSRIWRIDPNADGVLCSVNTPAAGCSRVGGRFTAIQDIAFNQRTSTLYVYQLAADGVLAFEAGFETGEFPPAVLLKVRGGERTRLAVRRLSEPGGVVVTRDGKVFVTDGLFTDGRLIRVRR
jgi:hypothetical protein